VGREDNPEEHDVASGLGAYSVLAASADASRQRMLSAKRGHAEPGPAEDCQRPAVWSGAVQVRYRYRLYPTPGQQQALARAFGCARVVYNDCLRVRDQAYAAGEKISDTAVRRA
jgi:hypothetical protein